MASILCLVLISAGAVEFDEDFDYPDGTDPAPDWFAQDTTWKVYDGALVRGGGATSFAVYEAAPFASAMTFEAEVTMRGWPEGRERGEDWTAGGVVLRYDQLDYWHIALVEAPESLDFARGVELVESKDGVWWAQAEAGTQLELLEEEGRGFAWESETPYLLRLVLAEDRIDGYVFELDGTQRTHIAYALSEGAVTEGRPALDAEGDVIAFDNVRVSITEEAAGPEPLVPPPFPAGGHPEIHAAATDFFYTKEIGGRWWLVDPNGNATFTVGAVGIWYGGVWAESLGYAPYGLAAEAKYGDEAAWADATLERIEDWGFTFLPEGHSESLRYRKFPHTIVVTMGSSYADLDALVPKTTWTGFPNVFGPDWEASCDKIARQACAAHRDDPWLLGYTFDNELEWEGQSEGHRGLFDAAWRKGPEHTAKQAWVTFLEDNLDGPEQVEDYWGLSISAFDELLGHMEPLHPRDNAAQEIARRWTRLVARKYFSACAEAIRRHDPNHLVLGCRFADGAPDIWDIAGAHCDVVTVNVYPRIDLQGGIPLAVHEELDGWHARCQKPMMVTEWSFPALDVGLRCINGAGMRVDTQAQRAQCFAYFQRFLFTTPYLVGSDFYQFHDDPIQDPVPPNAEDCNFGLVSAEDEPYEAVLTSARAINAQALELHAEGTRAEPARDHALRSWLGAPSPEQMREEEGPVTCETGKLSLTFPHGAAAWHAYYDGIELGSLSAFLLQSGAGDRWGEANRALVAGLYRDDNVTVLDVEMRYEASEDDDGAGYACRFMLRFWVPREDQEWAAVEWLWIENRDERAWQLKDAYLDLVPAIGGSQDRDAALPLPWDYYRRGAAWVDPVVGLGFGTWHPNTDDFELDFLAAGGQFQGLLGKVLIEPVDIAPGETYTCGFGPAFFFAMAGSGFDAFSAALDKLAQSALATADEGEAQAEGEVEGEAEVEGEGGTHGAESPGEDEGEVSEEGKKKGFGLGCGTSSERGRGTAVVLWMMVIAGLLAAGRHRVETPKHRR